MRTAIGAVALLVTVVSVTGCDSEQPLQIDAQTVDLTITAPSAIVPVYETWTMFEDLNGNGMSDDDYDGDGTDDEFLFCQIPFSGRTTTAASAPWPFSLTVSVLRDGATEPEAITSGSAIGGTGNLAAYDTTTTVAGFKPDVVITHPAGTCSGNAAIVCDPTSVDSIACTANGAGSCVAGSGNVTRTFVFTNGLRRSGASFEVLSSVTNPLYEHLPDPCPSANAGTCITLGTGAGTCSDDGSVSCPTSNFARCPGTDFGPSQIDGGPSPLSFQIENGDTVIVRARRLDTGPAGFDPLTTPGLSSSFMVDGQLVNVQGSVSQSANDPSGAIDFFFTSR